MICLKSQPIFLNIVFRFLINVFNEAFFCVFNDPCYSETFNFRSLDNGDEDFGIVDPVNVSAIPMSFKKRLDMLQSIKHVAKKDYVKGCNRPKERGRLTIGD